MTPSMETLDDFNQRQLEQRVKLLIQDAARYGFVVTIETVPNHPPAMGNYRMVGSVRRVNVNL